MEEPAFWWRARSQDVRGWVNEDPDRSDGRQRWPDRDEQRWPLIAAAVAAVGDQLAAGAWSIGTEDECDDEPPRNGIVEIGPGTGLTKTEWRIIRFEMVKADPWHEWLTNGRHRLWATLPHFADHWVPLASHVLPCANPDDCGSLPDWTSGYRANLKKLGQVGWFIATDPVNQRYLSALDTAARGEYPTPV